LGFCAYQFQFFNEPLTFEKIDAPILAQQAYLRKALKRKVSSSFSSLAVFALYNYGYHFNRHPSDKILYRIEKNKKFNKVEN